MRRQPQAPTGKAVRPRRENLLTRARSAILTAAATAAGVVALMLVLAHFGTRRVETKECFICRAQLKTASYAGINTAPRLEANSFTAWYTNLDRGHAHRWLDRASMGYDLLGRVVYSAQLQQHRIFSIRPEDEMAFLKGHFNAEEIRQIAHSMNDERRADDLYFAMYNEGEKASRRLDALRFWLAAGGIAARAKEPQARGTGKTGTSQ